MPSVTEILAWNQCHYLHHLRYVRRLEQLERPERLAIGSAVHDTFADVLTGKVSLGQYEGVAEAHYRSYLVGLSNIEELVNRNLSRITGALKRVPWATLGNGWKSETRLTVTLDTLAITGKPDLYRVTPDVIDIVEVKTTDHDPLDYILFNPQHRYYGVLLDELYPGRVVQFVYLCLSDRTCKTHDPLLLSRGVLDNSRSTLVDLVGKVGTDATPNEGWWCNNCEMKEICEQRIMTGSGEQVIANDFVVREHR